MKISRLALFLFAFAVFLLPGYWIGKHLRSLSAITGSSKTIATNCQVNEQVHILLINTGNLESRSVTMQSVWWIIFAPNSSLQWIPVYPSPTGDVAYETQLENTFGLAKAGGQKELKPSFVRLLRDRDLCWDGYLISDNTMLSAIVDDIGGVTLRSSHLSGSQVIARQEIALVKKSTSLSFQSELMEEICWNVLHSSITRKLDQPAPGLEHHIILNFSSRIDPVNWHSWNQVLKVPKCDIQTINTLSSLP